MHGGKRAQGWSSAGDNPYKCYSTFCWSKSRGNVKLKAVGLSLVAIRSIRVEITKQLLFEMTRLSSRETRAYDRIPELLVSMRETLDRPNLARHTDVQLRKCHSTQDHSKDFLKKCCDDTSFPESCFCAAAGCSLIWQNNGSDQLDTDWLLWHTSRGYLNF